MLVSIILNNYNYDAYLREAIDSALAQTYGEVEIIVVDDGSTDNSKDIIKGYGDKIQSIFKENGGQVSAVNLGFEASKGEVIIFLDSDDVLFPETAQKCIEAFNSGNYSAVYYLLQKVDGNLNLIGGVMPTYEFKKTPPLEDIKLWGGYMYPPTSGQAYKRDFLEKVMPAPNTIEEYGYILSPDGYLPMLCGITENISFINQPLGYYRIHGNNVSGASDSFSKEKLRQLFMLDYIREIYGHEYAKTNNIEIKEDLSVYHPNVFKLRFIAYRLYKDGHPIKDDNYIKLLLKGLKGVFIFPYLSFKKRIVIFIGILIIAILPKFALKPFVDIISSQNKKAALKAIFTFKKKSCHGSQNF